jgi:hypothetical protein
VKMVVSNPRSFARVWLGTTPSPEIMLQNPFWEDREGSQTGSARPGVTSHFHLWNLGFQDGVPTPSSPHPQLWSTRKTAGKWGWSLHTKPDLGGATREGGKRTIRAKGASDRNCTGSRWWRRKPGDRAPLARRFFITS